MKPILAAIAVALVAETAMSQVSPPRQTSPVQPPPLQPLQGPGGPVITNNVRRPPLSRAYPGIMTNTFPGVATNVPPVVIPPGGTVNPALGTPAGGQPVLPNGAVNPNPGVPPIVAPPPVTPGSGPTVPPARLPGRVLPTNGLQPAVPVGTNVVNPATPGPGASIGAPLDTAAGTSRGAGFSSGSASMPGNRAAITPVQRQHIGRISTELGGIRVGPQATPAQRQRLLSVLQASALGGRRPAEHNLNTLVDSLVDGWPGTGLAPQQRAQLAIDVSRVLNSANLSPAETQMVINDAQRVLLSGGMSPQAVDNVVNSLSAIVGEMRQGGASSGAAAAGVSPSSPNLPLPGQRANTAPATQQAPAVGAPQPQQP